MRVPAWFSFGKGPLSGSEPVPSRCVLTRYKGGRELSQASFIRVLTPPMRARPSRSNHFLKAPSPNTITLGIRIQHMNGGDGGQAQNSDNSTTKPWDIFEQGSGIMTVVLKEKSSPIIIQYGTDLVPSLGQSSELWKTTFMCF